ncbi:MAG: SH3 domain-containing protein [Pseudomonadota bacterium]
MRIFFALCCALGLLTGACAGEMAHTIRATDMKAKPYGDALTLTTLLPRIKLEVLKRQSSWTQVKLGKTIGWVKMLSLQLETGTTSRRADNGLSALFNVAATGRGGSSVTTGVRGLSEEQLKDTQPNPQELEKAKRYMSSREDAQRFAAAGKLKSQSLDYLSGGEK